MLKKIIVAGHGKWCEESLKLLKKKYIISNVIGRYKTEDISLKKRWIGIKQIKKSIKFYGNCKYSKFLKGLIKN